jgi:hypothetical protein
VQIDFPDVKDVLMLPIASVQHGRVHLKAMTIPAAGRT